MIFSKKWLDKYFKNGLPEVNQLAEVINLHAFEVEEIRAVGDDFLLDISILPDRSCYASSHFGMAREISAISNLPMDFEEKDDVSIRTDSPALNVEIKDFKDCYFYSARLVENISVSDSPEEIKDALIKIGERSINNIVDATNYCLFDVGEPLHAFDADKVRGKITVRRAKNGETIETLDGREVALDKEILIIADEVGPLAIAGIKGGKRAEVNHNTKRIIIESATFNPSLIRRTVNKINIKTSASKRFESDLDPVFATLGMREVSNLLAEILPTAKFGPIVFVSDKKDRAVEISLEIEFVSKILGISVSEDEIMRILRRFGIVVEKKNKKLVCKIPVERKDLNLAEDLVEEIGRVLGYHLIKPKLPLALKTRPLPNRRFSAVQKIRQVLIDYGYFDSILYSFDSKGIFEVLYPMASDKNFLRTNLAEGLLKSIKLNVYNSPILGLDEIRLFEIGQVFTEKGERTNLGIVVAKTSGKAKGNYGMDEVTQILGELENILQTKFKLKAGAGSNYYLAEVDLTDALDRFIAPYSYEELGLESASTKHFESFSNFPFVLRDIAIFTPIDTSESALISIIKDDGGELLKRVDLFDVFEKEFSGKKRKSSAFHLVFQANNRTLTDEEVNIIMDKITTHLNLEKNFNVR